MGADATYFRRCAFEKYYISKSTKSNCRDVRDADAGELVSQKTIDGISANVGWKGELWDSRRDKKQLRL
jgi:hypothetical protein